MASHLHDYNPTARSAFLTSIGLVMTITLCCFYFVFRSQAAGEPEPGSQISNGERQVANIPYFIESEEFHSTLILNNNQTEEKLATVTFFNSEGKRWEHAPIRLKPRLVQRFLLSDLLKKAPSDFRSGNIQIVHHGLPFDVMAQITVASDDQRLSFESIRTAASDFVMSRLDGIYWVPDSQTEAKVALTNAGTIKLGVTIIAGQNEEKVSLRPRETRVFDLREFVRDAKAKDSATLVTLEHDGAPGALIATGFALNRRTGFSSNLTFADCGTAKSMSLAGAHIRLGPADPSEGFPSGTVFRAPLLIANTMDELVSARISIEYTMGGQPASVQLSPISLASRQVKKVELGEELERRGITGLLDDAGIDISYDGMPGTVIGRLTSYDTSKEFAFDVPIKDPQGGPSNGGYPWRLDDGYTTVLHLKNTLDKEVKAIYRLIYEDGEYNPEPVKLAPHQTIAIDIRKLRDAQTKDLRGAIMPRDIETGKIVWMGLDQQFVIIGRAEVAKISTGIASSFSCNVCECGQVYVRDIGYTPYLSPGSLTMPVDATGSFSVNEYMKTNCSNDYWGPVGPSSTPSWNSSDTSVATVSGQTITARGPGTTEISANWCCDLVAYGYNCTSQYSGGGATATLNVRPTITSISPNKGLIGQPINVTITGSGFVAGSSVTIDSGTVQNLTVQSSTTITANYTSNDNASGGNHLVTVTSNTQTSTDNVNFYVQIPTSLQVLFPIDTIPTTPIQSWTLCQAGRDFGIAIAIQYQVLDQEQPAQPILSSGMEPQEVFTNRVLNGVHLSDASGDVGPSGYPGSAQFTDSNGRFIDAPYGGCDIASMTYTWTQTLHIVPLNQNDYVVRVNIISLSSTSSGSGSISNGSDIVKSRP